MRRDFDAVIIGAGPAGASAAILLARAGWSVALVEKQCFPRRKVCGECIAATNLPLLEALGIGPALDALAGPPLRRLALMQGDQSVEAELPASMHPIHHWGRALGRETLDSLLLEQARSSGTAVLQPWSAQSIDGVPGNWRCEIRSMDSDDMATLTARVAIDAHGSWEALPCDRRIRRRARRADLFAFKANFCNATLPDGLLPVLALDGGYGGMVVADGGLTTVACCIRRDRLAACRMAAPGMGAGDAVEAHLRSECRGLREALYSATRVGPWLAAGPLRPGIRVGDVGRPFRTGNAAGEAHPIIGEGMSMALQSSWLLCGQLLGAGRDARAPDQGLQRELGRRYANEWRRQFRPRLLLAAAFAHLAMRPGPGAPLMSLARTWPGLLTISARVKAPLKPPRKDAT